MQVPWPADFQGTRYYAVLRVSLGRWQLEERLDGVKPPEAVGEQMFKLPSVAGLFLLAAGSKLLLANSAHFISISGSGAPSSFWIGTHFYYVWKHICAHPN